MYLRWLYLCVFVLTVKNVISEELKDNEILQNLRLPNDTVPISYDIHILTNAHRGLSEFNGTTKIHIKIIADTDSIILHAFALTDFTIELVNTKTGLQIDNITFNHDNQTDFLTIFSDPFPLDLKSGDEYSVTISYNGILFDGFTGFYLQYYRNTNRYKVPIASTHFEATAARNAFPCYDEPSFKAVFIVTITHGSNYTALSNMPEDGEPIVIPIATTKFEATAARNAFPCYDEPPFKAIFTITITHGSNYTAISNMPEDGKPIDIGNGMTTTKFLPTPPMSTYTLAFVISNQRSTSLKLYNTTHRVFSPPEFYYNEIYTLYTASVALHEMEEYFGIDYPLPKMDHISVPQLRSSAMENWGLTIYAGWKFDVPVQFDSIILKIKTIYHEMAHQWFGNLVTLKWWDSVWLNEGFASLYGFKFIDKIHPQWNYSDYAKLDYFSYENAPLPFMNFNQTKKDPSPLTNYEETKKGIRSNFAHAYDKGSYMLHMIENALSEDTFKKGVIYYLKKFQYSVADEDDLFECLQHAATEDQVPFLKEKGAVSKVFKTWTQLPSYPVINVTRDYEKGTFTLHQEGFNSTDKRKWWIPITFSTAKHPYFHTSTDFMFPNTNNITIDPSSFNKTLKSTDWLILNNQQIAPYRVNYDEKNWRLLIKALHQDPSVIHKYNKARLIRDVEFFNEEGCLSSKIVFELISYLANEEDVVPWMRGIRYIRNTFLKQEESNLEYFNYFSRNLFKNIYEKIGLYSRPDDTAYEHFFRKEMKNFACHIDLGDSYENSKCNK